MNPIWFLRMARWVRHPPSWQRVVLVLVVIGICAVIFAYERIFGWPDWLTVERQPARVRVQPLSQ